MSMILSVIRESTALLRANYANKAAAARCLTLGSRLFNEENEEAGNIPQKKIDPAKDRSKTYSYETSVRYLASKAYETTYGSDPVWKHYRRNHKGAIPPRKTRKTCIRNGVISTGSPCPICRDEYLVLDHRNPKLLQQFISEYNGEILSYRKTGICQRKYEQLLVAISKARDRGTITYDVPFRTYDYSEWYTPERQA